MLRLFKKDCAKTVSDTIVSNTTSAAEIGAFVDRLAREYFLDGPDRRAEPRVRLTLPVVLQPVDEQFGKYGQEIRAVTRDISSRGLGLVCQDPMNHKYLAVSLVSPCGAVINLVAEVLRCEPVGYYYEVGCRFVVDAS